jgi:hypothetical protein
MHRITLAAILHCAIKIAYILSDQTELREDGPRYSRAARGVSVVGPARTLTTLTRMHCLLRRGSRADTFARLANAST